MGAFEESQQARQGLQTSVGQVVNMLTEAPPPSPDAAGALTSEVIDALKKKKTEKTHRQTEIAHQRTHSLTVSLVLVLCGFCQASVCVTIAFCLGLAATKSPDLTQRCRE